MRGIRLTEYQRDELLTSYRNRGYQATKQLAISFGISPRYIARLARRNGFTNNYQYGVTRGVVKTSAYIDKRWQWAVERGSIDL